MMDSSVPPKPESQVTSPETPAAKADGDFFGRLESMFQQSQAHQDTQFSQIKATLGNLTDEVVVIKSRLTAVEAASTRADMNALTALRSSDENRHLRSVENIATQQCLANISNKLESQPTKSDVVSILRESKDAGTALARAWSPILRDFCGVIGAIVVFGSALLGVYKVLHGIQ